MQCQNCAAGLLIAPGATGTQCAYCGRVQAVRDDQLDLDDVCAGHPQAQAELAGLRAQVADLKDALSPEALDDFNRTHNR